MRILGISCFYHDSAAALIEDGMIIAAAQEERFTRIKHDAEFPKNALRYCLKSQALSLNDIDAFVFYEKPFPKFERLVETYLAFAPRGFGSFAKAMPLWIKDKIFQKQKLAEEIHALDPSSLSVKAIESRLLFSEHHLSHAASAFYPSGFREAAVLCLDGVGEWSTSSLWHGRERELTPISEIQFPHSLGLLYSAFTYYAGFKVNSGEYKLMGLAPYGEPRFVRVIFDKMIDLKPDGSFHLNLEYFDYCTGLKMTNHRFDELFGQPARTSEATLTQFHMDIAASIQAVTEEIVLRLVRHAKEQTKANALCLAGGVALNCVANGHILRERIFDRLWIQPAAGDAGGAIGAALAAYHMAFDKARVYQEYGLDLMRGSYLGPDFSQQQIEDELRTLGAKFEVMDDGQVIEQTAEALKEGAAVGWHQGALEFGPRALGNRSILGNPQSSDMQSTLNLKVKFRESFRPFAPAVLQSKCNDWFDLKEDSPYMLLVAPVQSRHCRRMSDPESKLFGIAKLNVPRSTIPAVTHVDYSARVQTVRPETNPRFHQLLSRFDEKTGCPVLVNTSFNVRGEPIVCSPSDSFRCFMGTHLDVLVVGNCFLKKSEQPSHLLSEYKDKFELD